MAKKFAKAHTKSASKKERKCVMPEIRQYAKFENPCYMEEIEVKASRKIPKYGKEDPEYNWFVKENYNNKENIFG